METVGIIICNYNKQDYVVDCIKSVLESVYTDYRIYVIDNASTDDSVKEIKKNYGTKVELIVNKENLGGSGGFNTGIRRALMMGHKYVWCLDNDVLVDENALGALVEFLDNNPETGMVGSKVYHMENPDIVQQFGITIDFDAFCVEANYLNKQEDGSMPEVVYSDAVAACSVLVRSELIQKIGVMPEENFLYWDDTEWGFLCNRAGFKVASYGKSQVLHAMGAKKESENTFPTYYAWRNWIHFFILYTPEEKLEKMCETFLGSVFEVNYEGLYRGEKNKAMTVMCAYDDALHGVTGKAEEGIIVPLDIRTDRMNKLIVGKRNVWINTDGYDRLSDRLSAKFKEISPMVQVTYEETKECDLKIVLCESIFMAEDLTLKKVFIDIDENILSTQEDALMVINYTYSKRSFIFSQKPLFMNLMRKIRNRQTL